MTTAEKEIAAGERFGFGANWAHFLSTLDQTRIDAAQQSLCEFLDVERLDGRRFLDIGCGSGLFSLAARRLGATVHSFDFDPRSVACAQELKRRYFADDPDWTIEQGSVLDAQYLRTLGTHDVVYSWGVLHHTGQMWVAFEHAIGRVAPNDGKLFIAIYNDQGWKSHVWWLIKLVYNRLPGFLRTAYVWLIAAITRVAVIVRYTLKGQPMSGIRPMFRDRRVRGMQARYDRVDWIGGFPYEFATLETLQDYFVARGFRVLKTSRNTSLGCHELALQRISCAE
jgi:2-polyprenyl-6-hydroxyphenyl methylase/3-demethylubiquinone-9 3-methyltransferase